MIPEFLQKVKSFQNMKLGIQNSKICVKIRYYIKQIQAIWEKANGINVLRKAGGYYPPLRLGFQPSEKAGKAKSLR